MKSPPMAGSVEHSVATGFDDGLPRSNPADAGADASAILDFLQAVETAGVELHSLMIYRRGAVIAEGWWSPYRPELLHMQHSLTKSFMITAVGLAVSEGRFSLSDKVVSFFPEKLPAQVGDNLAEMTVRDLATMRSGAKYAVSGKSWRPYDDSWIERFFAIPVTEKPGARFLYSSAPSYMLSAIVQKTTGDTVHDYLRPRLFEPLGISDLTWDVSPEGINPGGNGLSCRTSDLLKLGAVHLQQGQWNGAQLIPSEWVAAALSPQGLAPQGLAPRSDRLGYGYHWWLGPRRAALASGAFGQYSIVLPDEELVIAVTAAQDTGPENRFLPLVWEYAPKIAGGEGPADATEAVRRKLATLTLLAPPPYRPSPRASVLDQRFVVEPNDQGLEAVGFEFGGETCCFWTKDQRGEHHVGVGLGQWMEGTTSVTGHALHHEYQPAEGMRVAAFGEWLDADTFRMTWQFNESAFRDTVTCRIVGDRRITLDRSVNVNTGPLSLPTVRGAA